MNLLFLGQLSTYESFLLPFLSEHGYDTTVINNGHSVFPTRIEGTDIPVNNLYERSKLHSLFRGHFELFTKPIFYGLFGMRARSTIKRIIKQEEIDVVYGSWGSYGLPEFRLLRGFKVPTVYEFRAYPVGTVGFAVEIENLLNRSVVQGLTGRVFSTQKMLGYIKKKFDVRYGRNIVFAECYPKKCFYHKRLPLLSEHDDQRHLLFIGLDAYDILPQMKSIARRKIHVHFPSTKAFPENKDPRYKEFIHAFGHFDHYKLRDGEFGTFMTQFDACLVTYNFSRVPCLDKFRNSVPARFSFALTGGIPIVMPRGYFDGCEEIVATHQIGFAYTDYDDLVDKLNNGELMDWYRRNAAAKSKKFTLEDNFQKIDAFIKRVCHDNMV